MGELSPGVTPRRYIPEGGLQKLRDKIHKESKFADDHKKLPFTFSKPTKPKRHDWFSCVECARVVSAPKNTFMFACPTCKKATKVVKIDE